MMITFDTRSMHLLPQVLTNLQEDSHNYCGVEDLCLITAACCNCSARLTIAQLSDVYLVQTLHIATRYELKTIVPDLEG
jgi:hypothetical protein